VFKQLRRICKSSAVNFGWGEAVSSLQWIGIGLMPVAIVLMRPNQQRTVAWNWKSDGILLLNFILAGIIGLIHKWTSLAVSQDVLPFYQTCLFSSATIITVVYVIWKRVPHTRLDIGIGTAVGLCNGAGTAFLVLGLSALPATVLFPTWQSSIIGLNLILGWWIWHERLRVRQIVGGAIAVAVIVLTNL
ncbi:hypothetical protein ACFL1X_04550, partial [Candidatus Hydrogenedentota bacterium]